MMIFISFMNLKGIFGSHLYLLLCHCCLFKLQCNLVAKELFSALLSFILYQYNSCL